MYHTVIRKQLEYPADEPVKINLPLGVRRIRVQLEGRVTGAARFSFSRDVIIKDGGTLVTTGTPYTNNNINLPGTPIYLAAARNHSGITVRVDSWHSLDSTLPYLSHRFVVDPEGDTPYSWSNNPAWNYPEHDRAWRNEKSLLWQDARQPTLGLVGNSTSTYANAAMKTPILVMPSFVPDNEIAVPDGATLEEIHFRLLANRISVPDAPANNPLRPAMLCELDILTGNPATGHNYCAPDKNPNPIWSTGTPRWFDYFWKDHPLWYQYTTVNIVNNNAGICVACELLEETEESGVVYAAIWDAEVVIYYTV